MAKGDKGPGNKSNLKVVSKSAESENNDALRGIVDAPRPPVSAPAAPDVSDADATLVTAPASAPQPAPPALSAAEARRKLNEHLNNAPPDQLQAEAGILAKEKKEKEARGDTHGNEWFNQNPGLEEQIEKYFKDRAKVPVEDAKAKGIGDKGIAAIRKAGEWYKAQPLWKKIAVSGGIFGASLGGAFAGGAVGTMLLAGGAVGMAANRVLIATSAFVLAENLSRRFTGDPNNPYPKDAKFFNKHVRRGLYAAVLTAALPSIAQAGVSEVVEATGAKNTLVGEWLISQFKPEGADTGSPTGTQTHGINVNIPNNPDLAPGRGPSVTAGFESLANTVGLEAAAPAAAPFVQEITVPKGSNVWNSILKGLPDGMSERARQNMTGNIVEYLKAHPELNKDIHDLARVKINTVVNLRIPDEVMQNFYDRAVTRFGTAAGAVAESLPLPPPPPPGLAGIVGAAPAPSEASFPAPGFVPVIEADPRPIRVRPDGYLSNVTPAGTDVPHSSYMDVLQRAANTDLPTAEVLPPGAEDGLEVVTPNPHEFESFIQSYFGERGFFARFFNIGGTPDVWKAVADLPVADILDPQSAAEIPGLNMTLAERIRVDIGRVLQSSYGGANTVNTSKLTVRQLFERGVAQGTLRHKERHKE